MTQAQPPFKTGKLPDWARRIVAFDTETTGTDEHARIIEFGAVVWEDGLKVVSMAWLLDPGPVDLRNPSIAKAFAINQIEPEKLKGCPQFHEAWPQIKHALEQATVRVAHNAPFDQRMLRQEFNRAVNDRLLQPEDAKSAEFHITVDTLAWDLVLSPQARGRSLDVVGERWGVSGWEKHRAVGDAEAAARILHAMAPRMPWDIREIKDVQCKAQAKWQEQMNAMRARTGARP